MRRTDQSVRKTKKQRGGAPWKIPDGDRLGKWEAEINLLTDAKLKSDLLPLVTAGGIRGDESKKKRLESYLTAIEHQDELFDMALALIKTDLKSKRIEVSTDDKILENAMVIDNEKALAKLYIEDVEKMITFKQATETEGNLSKLQSINKPEEHLSALLLFPERLNNIFIQSLANLFVLLKKNPGNRGKITTNESTIRLATDQYISNIYANAYLLTSFDLRDGFFLSQGITDFQKIMEGNNGADGNPKKESFYSELLANINKTDALNLSRESSWAQRALAVFRWYLDQNFTENYERIGVLQFMITKTGIISDDDRVIIENVYDKYSELNAMFPDKVYLDISLDTEGTTLLKLLNIMGPQELEFVLHLAYTLWKSDKEQKESAA